MALNLGTVCQKHYVYQIPLDATAATLNADFVATFGDFTTMDEFGWPLVADRFVEDETGIWANDEMGGFNYANPVTRGGYLILSATGGGFSAGGSSTLADIESYYYVLEAPSSM